MHVKGTTDTDSPIFVWRLVICGNLNIFVVLIYFTLVVAHKKARQGSSKIFIYVPVHTAS